MNPSSRADALRGEVPAGLVPRRTWGFFAAGAMVLVALVAAIVIRAKWPTLNPAEAERVGTWYGYIEQDGDHYAWLAELRRDRTCRISFRDFLDVDVMPEAAVGRVIEASDVSLSEGSWRIDASGYTTTTWYPENDPGTMTRILLLLSEQRWLPSYQETFTYRVEPSPPGEFVYTLTGQDITYHAVRVPDDFELPDKVVLPPDAVAWWNHESARSPK
jgi:hypothetical protein